MDDCTHLSLKMLGKSIKSNPVYKWKDFRVQQVAIPGPLAQKAQVALNLLSYEGSSLSGWYTSGNLKAGIYGKKSQGSSSNPGRRTIPAIVWTLDWLVRSNFRYCFDEGLRPQCPFSEGAGSTQNCKMVIDRHHEALLNNPCPVWHVSQTTWRQILIQ